MKGGQDYEQNALGRTQVLLAVLNFGVDNKVALRATTLFKIFKISLFSLSISLLVYTLFAKRFYSFLDPYF